MGACPASVGILHDFLRLNEAAAAAWGEGTSVDSAEDNRGDDVGPDAGTPSVGSAGRRSESGWNARKHRVCQGMRYSSVAASGEPRSTTLKQPAHLGHTHGPARPATSPLSWVHKEKG